jgi:hypothetical protein
MVLEVFEDEVCVAVEENVDLCIVTFSFVDLRLNRSTKCHGKSI